MPLSVSTPVVALKEASIDVPAVAADRMSPEMKPTMLTVPLLSKPPLSASLTPRVESNATAAAPPVKLTVAPAVIAGATCTVVSVLPPELLAATPSVTVHAMVRPVSPPPVGSTLLGLTLKVIESNAV